MREQYLIAEQYGQRACYGNFSIGFSIIVTHLIFYLGLSTSSQTDFCFLEFLGFTRKLGFEVGARGANGRCKFYDLWCRLSQ